MKNRLELLQQFLEEDPADPFNLYALALEYQKHDKLKAKALFDELLTSHEDYVAAYYHAASLYLELDMLFEAKATLAKGILKAKEKNEMKAMREMQTMYDDL